MVRYIFAPLEEVVYNYFSRGDEKESANTLILLIKSITLFSCLSLTFGYNFSEAFLGFLYGEKWVDTDSVSALQIYTMLLSFLGINGVMEAFLFAKGGKSLQNYKYISIFPTSVYICLSFYFIRYLSFGTGSFFLANTVSMIIRIIISWNLEVKKHISLNKFLLSIKPSNLFLASLILTFLLGNPSLSAFGITRFNSYFKNMILGGALFGINILVIAF